MIAALLTAWALSAVAAPTKDMEALPEATRAELARVEEPAKRSALFRKLYDENDGLSRRFGAVPEPGFMRFELKPSRALVYDAARLKRATEWEVRLATARELARASMGLPAVIVEAEAAALQKELAVALELAEVEPEFSKAWAGKAKKAKDALEAAGRLDAWARARAPESAAEPWPKLPAGEIDRLAFFAALLAQGPERFYDGVGATLPLGDGACRLAEVADFTALHAADWKKAQPREGETFTLVGSSRYPTRVVRAARLLEPAGGADFAREAVGTSDADAVELTTRLRHWLKWPAP